MATLARRERESPADAEMIAVIRERFRANWTHFALVEVTQQLVELAGEYADTFALRGYDSVQLASAKIVQDGANQTLCFLVLTRVCKRRPLCWGCRRWISNKYFL